MRYAPNWLVDTAAISSSTALVNGPAGDNETVSPSRSPTHNVWTVTAGLALWRAAHAAANAGIGST